MVSNGESGNLFHILILSLGRPAVRPSVRLPLFVFVAVIVSPSGLSSVLKLLKMATGMRALLDTVVQALPQVRARRS